MSDTAADVTAGDLPADSLLPWAMNDITEVDEYAGRVILGAPGAGKATAALRLLHEMLADLPGLVGRRWQGAAHQELTFDKAVALLARPHQAPSTSGSAGFDTLTPGHLCTVRTVVELGSKPARRFGWFGRHRRPAGTSDPAVALASVVLRLLALIRRMVARMRARLLRRPGPRQADTPTRLMTASGDVTRGPNPLGMSSVPWEPARAA